MKRFNYKLKKKHVKHIPNGVDKDNNPKYKEKVKWVKSDFKKVYAINEDIATKDIYSRHAGLRYASPTMILVDFKEAKPRKKIKKLEKDGGM